MINGTKRNISIDILRIVACFFIVVRHATDGHNLEFSHYGTVFALRSISYPALAVFAMITGYFIFNKEESYGIFFKKRFNKLLIPFLFWSIVYFIYANHFFDLFAFINSFISNMTFYHLWYVYFIIGVYLLVPLVRKMVHHANLSDIRYIILLWIGTNLIFSFVKPNPSFMLGFTFSNWWGYIFLGYYLAKIQKSRGYLITSLILVALYSILSITTLFFKHTYLNYLDATSIPFIGCCFGIMYLFKYFDVGHSISGRVKNTITKISNLTFSIYLIHALMLDVFLRIFTNYYNQVRPIFGIPVESLIVFGFSLLIVFLINKLPYIKKIV